MNRRLCHVCLCIALAWKGGAYASSQRMNVLFLVVDDLNTWLLGDTNRYSGKVVAPNIRKLADSGVFFNRAYTACPFCSLSRTALLSGVSPWNSWDDCINHKRDPVPPGAPLTSVGRGEQDWGPLHLPEKDMNETSYADAAIRQLQTKHEKPFLIACGLFHPHMPWYVMQNYFDLFPLGEVTVPPRLENDLDDVPPLGRSVSAGKSKFVASVLGAGLHKAAVRAYLAATAYSDVQMVRVLQALENSPYRENTIVVLIGDHGFLLAEKDHWQKGTLWEEASHCLMMFRGPGMTPAGGVSERFVSIRDERFRYTRYSDDQEEFYDCIKDPHEWTSQIGNPEYAAEISRLRAAVPSGTEMASPVSSKKKGRKKK